MIIDKIIKYVLPSLIILYNALFLSHKSVFLFIIIIISQLIMYILIVIFSLWIGRRYKKWQNDPIRQYQNKIKKLNQLQIIHKENKDCVICLETLDFCIQLPCSHLYHRHCIDQLMEHNHDLCPLCRSNIV